MSQSKEIELKFQLSSPKEIRAILADELFAGQEKKEATTLYSTYYDTEDLRLNQNKIAYRIRKTAEGLEATAKAVSMTAKDCLCATNGMRRYGRDGFRRRSLPGRPLV